MGVDVILHLLYNSPPNNYTPNIEYKIITNIKNITTFPRSGKESIKVPTTNLRLFIEFILLNGLNILRVRTALKFTVFGKNYKKLETTTTKSNIFHPSLRYVLGDRINP